MNTFTLLQSLLIIILAAITTGLIVSAWMIIDMRWQIKKTAPPKKTMDEYFKHKEEVERKARRRL